MQSLAQQGRVVGRKLGFALLVFGATFGGVTQLRPVVMSQQPLPGDVGADGPCAVWFIGSSTIARWDSMAQDMGSWRTENRGVGGALIGELTKRFEIVPTLQHPGTLVVYVGDNDLAAGQTAEEVAAALFDFIAAIHARIPDARLVILGLKPSPARWSLRGEQLKLDTLMRDRFGAMPRITFADVGPSLLVRGAPGPFYADDGIHLNEAGYHIWGGAVRRAVEAAVSPDQLTRCTGKDTNTA